jgi:putative transposase
MAVSFKGAHFPQEVILMRMSHIISTRHVEELLEERAVGSITPLLTGGSSDTARKLEQAFHRRKRPVWVSWRMDETYIKVKGQWCHL